jgi:hypothetical protein
LRFAHLRKPSGVSGQKNPINTLSAENGNTTF